MARPTRKPRAKRPRYSYAEPLRLPAAEFKAKCLGLMDHVRETGAEYVVTKHGKPVAKLVPYRAPARKRFFGFMKGTVLKYDRPFDPIDGEYDINRD